MFTIYQLLPSGFWDFTSKYVEAVQSLQWFFFHESMGVLLGRLRWDSFVGIWYFLYSTFLPSSAGNPRIPAGRLWYQTMPFWNNWSNIHIDWNHQIRYQMISAKHSMILKKVSYHPSFFAVFVWFVLTGRISMGNPFLLQDISSLKKPSDGYGLQPIYFPRTSNHSIDAVISA